MPFRLKAAIRDSQIAKASANASDQEAVGTGNQTAKSDNRFLPILRYPASYKILWLLDNAVLDA